MKGLFPKIFLWLWLTLILIFASTTIWTFVTKSGLWFSIWRNAVEEGLKASGQGALSAHARQGKTALLQYFLRLERKSHIQFRLYTENGKELTGRMSYPEAEHLVYPALDNDHLVFTMNMSEFLAALRLVDTAGDRFVIVRQSTKGVMAALFSEQLPSLLFKILLAGAILSLLSFVLTRYITIPIFTLKKVVNQFTNGNFTIRAKKLLGHRKDEISKLGEDFDLMAEQIQSLMNTQKQLLRDISHELRSPLTRLSIALDLVKEDHSIGNNKYFQQIEKENDRMNSLIDQLLTVVRLQNGKAVNKPSFFNLTLLMNKVASNAAFEAQVKKCVIKCRLEEEVYIYGIEELIFSAIENVLRNSVYYTLPGTEIKISLERIEKDAHIFAVIEVHDQGPGVPEASLKDIFRPFFRLNEARDRRSGKTGLGLSIAEQAIHIHDGGIHGFNSPNGGFVVHMRLPAKNGQGVIHALENRG